MDLVWRGLFDSAELSALHAAGFGGAATPRDWWHQVNHHSLGWVTARAENPAPPENPTPAGIPAPPENPSPDGIPATAGNPTSAGIPATAGNPALAGFVNVAWDGGEHAFVLDTLVAPAAQRTGLGTALVHAAIDGARRAGCAWLHVDFEDHLAEFYREACGFRGTAAGVLRL